MLKTFILLESLIFNDCIPHYYAIKLTVRARFIQVKKADYKPDGTYMCTNGAQP